MTQISKVIVVGFDGLDPRITESMLASDALPNFAKLRKIGAYSRIRTTAPAQTPVAWSSFATGVNPGGHGIFDFLRRDATRYLPDLALSRYEQRSALLPPRAVNLRSGRTIWDALGEHGIPSTVIRCPCMYPAEPLRGRLLSGMGVPDVRGGIGTSTFYSSEIVNGNEGEVVFTFSREKDELRSQLMGPRLPNGRHATLAISLRAAPAHALLSIGDRSEAIELRLKKWSDWKRVKFKTGPLMSMTGLVRFHLRAISPSVELYASPINFDAHDPPFPISHPASYAGDLEDAIGAYATLGMPEDHTGLTNGRFDEDAFLAQCDLVMREREAMLQHELGRFERGFLYCLFDTPDRIQHMFWRFGEPDHPSNAVHGFDARYRNVIADHYRRCDDTLGEVLRAVDDRTMIMVLSDHGFGSFRRGVNVNAWLADNGWLALKPGADRAAEPNDFFREVDWSRTRAYALGFGGIYLNVQGREAEGVVAPSEREAEAARLAGQLGGLRDPATGDVGIRGAGTREQLYAGARADEAPDVLLRCAAGYRTSWSTALGGTPVPWFEDNIRKWSGDHIIDPDLIPGVLFANRAVNRTDPSLLDCFPTILAALGANVPPSIEGRSLLE